MQAQSATLDVMAKLKAHTAQHHRQVEKLMPFFEATFSVEEYVRILGIFLGFWEPLEQRLTAIADWQTVGVDVSGRCRANRLRGDLCALGVSEPNIESLPRSQSLPALANVYNGLGCLYVLEGSTLGGQLIARELTRRFGIDEDSGSSFFHSYGSNVGEAWKAFSSAVNTHVNDPAKTNAALTSAEATFVSLEGWVREVNSCAR